MLKYQHIAAEIETYIQEHALQQGDKLPVLDELMLQFGVSKSTIIKSLELLEEKGVIFQVRGSGIFVRRHGRKGYISLLKNQGFTRDLEEFPVTSQVLLLEIVKPNREVASNLNIAPDQDVYHVKRIRYIYEQTLCVEESYYNKAIVTYLNNEIVSDSIFDYIRDGLGLRIGFSDSYLHVDKLNAEEAGHLRLQPGEPKLEVETIFHLSNGQPFDFSKITYNYVQSQFFIQANGHRM